MNPWHSLVVVIGLVAAGSTQAEERIFLAGGEYSDIAYYTYAGLIVPGPGRENGRGLLQRYWVDRFGYEYDGAPGRVEADAFGAEAALGCGASSSAGWWTVSLGLRYTNTDLTPNDRSASAIASYSNQQNGYWGRLRVMHEPTPTTSLGVEFIANGNDEADSTVTGPVLRLQPAGSKWSVNLRAGYRFQDEDDGAYGGLEFGYGF